MLRALPIFIAGLVVYLVVFFSILKKGGEGSAHVYARIHVLASGQIEPGHSGRGQRNLGQVQQQEHRRDEWSIWKTDVHLEPAILAFNQSRLLVRKVNVIKWRPETSRKSKRPRVHVEDPAKVLAQWKRQVMECGLRPVFQSQRLEANFTILEHLPHLQKEIRYPDFVVSEPRFLNELHRKWFYVTEENRKGCGGQSPDRLQGAIWVAKSAIYHERFDCGYRSTPEDYRAPRMGSSLYRISDLVLPILVPDSNSFQHFLDGVLPKLIQALDVVLLPGVKLMIFRPRDGIILEILGRLGIPADKLVFYDRPYRSVLADLSINTCVTPPLHPVLWQTARHLITYTDEYAAGPEQQNSLVILLTRARSRNGGRKLLNHQEVERFLRLRYKAELHTFSGGYSLAETVSTFSRARVVIGVHGGALYNMNFAPGGAHVVEIFPILRGGMELPRLANRIFWKMANLLEQFYWRLYVQSPSLSGDVFVVLAELRQILDRIDQVG